MVAYYVSLSRSTVEQTADLVGRILVTETDKRLALWKPSQLRYDRPWSLSPKEFT